jgi:hypothetical protein
MATHHHEVRDVDTAPEYRGTDPEYRDTVRERHWDVAPGQIVSAIVGVGFVAMGVVAVARAGLDTPLSEPVVNVLGYTHTAWLGLIEIGVGLLLMLAGLNSFARAASVVLGTMLVVAGVLIQAIPEDLPRELALDEDMGMPLVVVGAIVALAAMILPAWRTRSVRRHTDLAT